MERTCLISKLTSQLCPEPALINEAMGASEHLLCPVITSAVLPREGLCEVLHIHATLQ